MLEPFTEEAIRFCLRFQSQYELSISVIANTQARLIHYWLKLFLATPADTEVVFLLA